MVALVVAFEGFALDGAVFAKIVQGNQAAVFLHFSRENVRRFAFVKIRGAATGDPFEGARQLRLLKILVPVVSASALQEDALRIREWGEGVGVGAKREHLPIGNGKP